MSGTTIEAPLVLAFKAQSVPGEALHRLRPQTLRTNVGLIAGHQEPQELLLCGCTWLTCSSAPSTYVGNVSASTPPIHASCLHDRMDMERSQFKAAHMPRATFENWSQVQLMHRNYNVHLHACIHPPVSRRLRQRARRLWRWALLYSNSCRVPRE
ncbi:hypothetical protein BRADI_2g54945v3 [Brachypodium distachyon]|uniref:Uncharacterized protein n=1 Tax=Brachypodium distachyon TaxID=15368 RepID=A0A2K2DFY0_BRADI|nr:hypothetical protein BRADI_2g54945v3 [Brachypodium distachyon]